MIKNGDRVKLHYIGRLKDGTVFSTSENQEPLDFIVGEGQKIKGLEEGVIGLELGDKKIIKVLPEDGYGQRYMELIKEIPIHTLPADLIFKLREGMIIPLQIPSGKVFPAVVLQITQTSIIVDFNHPLAAQVLIFEVNIVAVNDSTC